MKLQNKVAVVTGGGSGLGREFCIQMAHEGAKIVVADINKKNGEETVKLIEAAGGKAYCFEINVVKTEHINNLIASVLEVFGTIDILCNNAGITGERTKCHQVTEDSWDTVLEVNLKSIFLMSKAIIPIMIKQGGGVIINTASASGIIASAAGVEYTAAKHGVIGLTKQLSYEYGHEGIRVVAIAPGVIKTPLTKQFSNEDGPFHQLTMNAPAGRYGEPIEIAKVVTFLASKDASFIHGHVIPIEGGSTIL
ncbi:beta-ketoacyl-ACP reductase [Thalassobacillus devorans]|uniref:Beta-ketoacyl-ACP reductase n=1 Tax=Thalassobacillus devorans TaxID=279813 RepID=A0ABQ1P986_9BACI|nr:glucose 1-dehydrogenase [Thalassobacillus devorans]NIK28047.1 3-oxoacyl-[acyl-carrier protein] reductase [Thalassobacillus devorans]GGC89296.1 beta-ketoacyl-ACP reductase [Thalassobacillus devorans]